MDPSGHLFCPHLTDAILACGEKYGVPIVKQCFDGENGFADRLEPKCGDPKAAQMRDGVFSDVEFAQCKSDLLILANRHRLKRAAELRNQRGRVRAGRPAKLSLREELKKLQNGSSDDLEDSKDILGHGDAARIFRLAEQNASHCSFCFNVRELMKHGRFWNRPSTAGSVDTTGAPMGATMNADCLLLVQDVAAEPPVHLLGLCDQSRWKLAVILSQFGVLPFEMTAGKAGAKPTKTQTKTQTRDNADPHGYRQSIWNIAMVVILPGKEQLASAKILSAFQPPQRLEEIRRNILRYNSTFASASIHMNRGLVALRADSPFVSEQKCPEAIGVLAPMCV
jgi:hypothetical protein